MGEKKVPLRMQKAESRQQKADEFFRVAKFCFLPFTV